MSSFLQDADSSCAPLVAAKSIAASRTSAHNKGKKTSAIWNHAREPLKYEDQELLYYSYYKLDN